MSELIINKKKKKVIVKGRRTYALFTDGVMTNDVTVKDAIKTNFNVTPEKNKEMYDSFYDGLSTKDYSDLMTGVDFLSYVQDGGIMNYDGYINEVFVDGYDSNVRLVSENGFVSDGFCLSEEMWGKLCKEHEVYVDWVNK